jgi:hypothetical protein
MHLFLNTPQYSPELIERIQTYFRKKYNRSLSEEIAVTYLDALANLFASFHDLVTNDNQFEPDRKLR